MKGGGDQVQMDDEIVNCYCCLPAGLAWAQPMYAAFIDLLRARCRFLGTCHDAVRSDDT